VCQYPRTAVTSSEIRRLKRKLKTLEGIAEHESVVVRNSEPTLDTALLPTSSLLRVSANPDAFRYPLIRQTLVDSSVTNEVIDTVGDTSKLLAEADTFFETVHCWMPIVSKREYVEELKALTAKPSAETALLALCVHVIIQLPEKSNSENMRTVAYAKAKSLAALVEAAGILSLRTVESLLLIALYELGHGFNTSYASISHAAGSARILGIQNLCSEDRGLHIPATIAAEEGRRAWWALVLLDRHVLTNQHTNLFPIPVTCRRN
jgi:hypothetical protein